MEERNQKIENKVKEEKGSVAVLVLVTIIAFLIVLTAFYFRSTYVRKAQLQTDGLLKNIYESQVNDEITEYSWKSYVQDGLMLHYDGINNTGNGHSETTDTWKDLSGNGNDGTLKGTNYLEESGWKSDCLKMDGIDDWVDTGLDGKTTFTPQDDFTMSIVFDFNTLTNEGNTSSTVVSDNGDTGVLLGSPVSFGGYAIYWITRKSDNENISIESAIRDRDTFMRFSTSRSIQINTKTTATLVYSYTQKKVSMYVNGELLSEQAFDGEFKVLLDGNIAINKPNIMRGDYKTNYADLNVYSARIYNRALTADEIKQNQKVDRQRFEV